MVKGLQECHASNQALTAGCEKIRQRIGYNDRATSVSDSSRWSKQLLSHLFHLYAFESNYCDEVPVLVLDLLCTTRKINWREHFANSLKFAAFPNCW